LYWLPERQHGAVFNIVQTKASELTSGSPPATSPLIMANQHTLPQGADDRPPFGEGMSKGRSPCRFINDVGL
jgi:hypothetical protein